MHTSTKYNLYTSIHSHTMAGLPAAAAGGGLAAALAALPAAAAPTANTPSQIAPIRIYRLISEMVKINMTMVWNGDMEATTFLQGLESILFMSPVQPTHYITLLMLMIPGQFEIERLWVSNNIITPLLSWNAAKAAFLGHFQRGDYEEGRRTLYDACAQGKDDSTQDYSRRFQTLTSQLGLADANQQVIHDYIRGLQRRVQLKLSTHKAIMRTTGAAPNPVWNFTSLDATIRLAVMMDTDPIIVQRVVTHELPPHLRNSSLANPSSKEHSAPSADKEKVKDSKGRKKRKASPERKKPEKETKICDNHPDATSHTTEECRMKVKSPEKKKVTSNYSSPSEAPSSRQSQRAPTQLQSGKTQGQGAGKPTASRNNRSLSEIQCYRCKEYGHYANTCLKPAPLSFDNVGKKKARQATVKYDENYGEGPPSPHGNQKGGPQ